MCSVELWLILIECPNYCLRSMPCLHSCSQAQWGVFIHIIKFYKDGERDCLIKVHAKVAPLLKVEVCMCACTLCVCCNWNHASILTEMYVPLWTFTNKHTLLADVLQVFAHNLCRRQTRTRRTFKYWSDSRSWAKPKNLNSLQPLWRQM